MLIIKKKHTGINYIYFILLPSIIIKDQSLWFEHTERSFYKHSSSTRSKFSKPPTPPPPQEKKSKHIAWQNYVENYCKISLKAPEAPTQMIIGGGGVLFRTAFEHRYQYIFCGVSLTILYFHYEWNILQYGLKVQDFDILS